MKLTKSWKDPFTKQLQEGKVGYALLWMLGIPLPILLLFYFFRGH